MRRVGKFTVLIGSLAISGLLGACDGSGVGAEPGEDAGADAISDDGGGAEPEVAADVETEADAGPVEAKRLWTYRAIGGVSMGAAAVNIALMEPELFDVVGGLGGYIDWPYMVTAGLRLQLGGFCDLETLEANVDSLNDPDADPPVFCGPVQPVEELEEAQDFDHLRYDTNGAEFDRAFYMDVFQGLTMAFGNFTSEPTGDSPYLPTGVDFDWFTDTPEAERCATPAVLDQAASYNAEYNPDGTFPVITLCEARHQVTPGLGGADFDPAATPDSSTDILLAVDINGNGRRDYAEPLFVNAVERFEDVGADGCPDAREDGAGGCLAEGAPDAGEGDPNGDDFHWWDNPDGTEGNSWWNEGEPYEDLGLDGVAGTGDTGEGNGEHDMTTAFSRAQSLDATTLMRNAPAEALARMDFYFDGGIRDPLDAAVAMRHVVGQLKERVGEELVHVYHGIAGRPGSFFPEAKDTTYLSAIFAADVSEEAVGRHVYVEYGDPDATPEQIAAGDGAHVGTDMQILNRLIGFLAFAGKRFPGIDDIPPSASTDINSEYHHFYSAALGARRGYNVALPPPYYAQGHADADVRYPVIYFLHGHGQTAEDLAPAAIATSLFMRMGQMPMTIFVFPDGGCCDVNLVTGERECACRRGPDGFRICVDPQCTGPEDECEERKIPKNDLTEECNGGSLYLDLTTDRWGHPRDDLGYATSVLEVVHDVDQKFRVRAPELR